MLVHSTPTCGARVSCFRRETPIMNVAKPTAIVSNERNEDGSPEKGVSIPNIPSTMIALVRDMAEVYQGATMTTNSPRTVSGRSAKCACTSAAVPEITSSCIFVSSRATTTRGAPPSSNSFSSFNIRCGDS